MFISHRLKVTYHNVSLLHHNHEPESRIKESSAACYLQICALNRIEPSPLLSLVDETCDDTEAHIGSSNAMITRLVSLITASLSSTPSSPFYQFFYFDRPFYMNADESKESVENLWIERTILVQVDY